MSDSTIPGSRTRIPATPRERRKDDREVGQPNGTQDLASPGQTHLAHALSADAAAHPRRAPVTRQAGASTGTAQMPAGQAQLLREIRQLFEQGQPDAARESLSVRSLCARFGPAVITISYESAGQADHYLNRYANQLSNFILVLDGLPQIAEKYGYAACNSQLPARVRDEPAITIKPQRQPEPLQALENFCYVRELLKWIPQQLARNDNGHRAQLKAMQKNVLSDLQSCAIDVLAALPALGTDMPRLANLRDELQKLANGKFPDSRFESIYASTALLAAACVPGKEARLAMESAPATQRERAKQIVELCTDEKLGDRKILLRSSPFLLHDLDLIQVKKDSKQETVTASSTGVTSLLQKELEAQSLGTVLPLVLTRAQLPGKNAAQAPPKVRAGAVSIELYDDEKNGVKQVARSQTNGLLLADFTLFKA